MLRRSVTGAVLGVLALTAAACSSSSSTPKAGTSTTAAATSGATASSSAPATSTGATSAPATTGPAPSASAATGGAGHGGVTLATSAALSTKQGTKPLTVENNPIPSLEQNFNAFDSNGFGYKLNVEGLFYEPLLMFNDLKPNTAYPWLATDFAWNTDGTQITFTLRDGVKFSDGTPLTADDVAYTYQVMKDTPAANRSGLPVDSAKAVGTNKVTITFTAPQFQNIFNIAGQTFIVKKATYSAAPDASKFVDKTPIGTGPYTLAKFSPQGLTFKANPTYWGGKPPVPQVNVPSFSTNDVALQQLAQGKIDYAGNFIDQIKKTFVAKDPAHNKYWFPAINVVNLIFNVGPNGPKALQDPAVRKAISAGIDRTKVAGQAEQGYEAPATSSSGLLLPNFASLLPAAYKNDLKPGVDAASVSSILTAAGYAKNGKGFWAKGGNEIAFKIEDPSAYTDYYNAAKIMAADFQKLGINATASGVDPNKWYADLAAGTFDTAIHWSVSGPSPYATYQGWLDPALSTGANAKNAPNNFGRFVNDAAKSALADYAKAGTAEGAATAVNALAKIMNEQVPVAPIMYAAGWYEYNTKNYSGWVDANHQYMDPAPNPAGVAYVILHLTPN
ncbi:MAG: peptide/nickel transport system substrate-binding protein [Frankiales bacterium]|jgi:peptide/nickel transport system substrate-binding protein|nr:peptide/nickel transport system substrate-binding protein [Frankiales bacterium]